MYTHTYFYWDDVTLKNLIQEEVQISQKFINKRVQEMFDRLQAIIDEYRKLNR